MKQVSNDETVARPLRGAVVRMLQPGAIASTVEQVSNGKRWIVANSELGELDDAGRKFVASLSPPPATGEAGQG